MHSLLIIIWTYPSSPFHRLKYHHNWKFPLTKPKVRFNRFNFQSNSSIDQHTTEKNWVSLTLRLTRFMLVLAIFGHSFFVFLFLFFQRDRMTEWYLFSKYQRKFKIEKGHIFLFLIQNEIRMPNNESSRVIKRKIVVIVPVQCWHFKANTCALQCKAIVAALRRLTPHG